MRGIFSEVPFLKLVLPLIGGVFLYIAFGDLLPVTVLPVAAGIILLAGLAYVIVFRRLNLKAQFRFKITEGLGLFTTLLATGYLLAWFYTTVHYTNHYSRYVSDGVFYVATIQQPVREKEKIVAAIAEVIRVERDSQTFTTQGQVLLNFVKEKRSIALQYGDRIIFHSEVKDIEGPKNPYEFDFKRYQKFHRIYQSAYVNSLDWRVVSSGNGNAFMASIYSLRDAFLRIIKKHVTNPDDLAVASAMLLGYRDYMTADVVQAYANSGTLHVLSVSGLHVGIVFLILNALLTWMDKRGGKWKIAKAVFIIAFIWFYACLTGLSPSVLRSAAMFSMLQFGLTMNRNANIYNTIAASVFVLMLFNPFIIADVGFLLSYIAVIGIVYLYPKIYSAFTTKVWLLDKAWQIAAMSIAAQIATFPISIYYFYQFPNLFLLSNLVIVPASGFIMPVGVLLFAVDWIPFVGEMTGWMLNKSIWLTNWFTFFTDEIPFNKTEGINFTIGEMWLLYVIFFLLIVYIETKVSKWFLAALGCFLLLNIFFAVDYANSKTQKQFAVYSVKGQRAIAFIADREVVHDFDTALLHNRTSMLFHVRHHWWRCGVDYEKSDARAAHQLPFGRLVQFAGKRVLIVNAEVQKPKEDFAKFQVHYVVLSGNAKINLQNLQAVVDFKELIFDSSNKAKQVALWKKDCEKFQLAYYDVAKQGAFVRNL